MLQFASLDEIMPDVDPLLAGHATVGNWTLGQILHHLAMAVRLSLDGPPGSAEPTRSESVLRRRFFRSQRFPENATPPLPSMFPPAGADAPAEAAALRTHLERFLATTVPLAAHPVLGSLNKEEWTRFHCLHCAHHLSFVHPGDRPEL